MLVGMSSPDSPPVSAEPTPNAVYVIGRAVLRPLLWLRYRPIVRGREHVPAQGPVLFVSNHLSAIDTILIPSFAPRRVQFLAKESLFHGRFRGWFMRSIGAVPVYRSAGAAAQAALDTGRRVLEAGGVFAVFPEGSRSTTGKLNRGRTGAAWLALTSGATVVPIGLVGTGKGSRRIARAEMNFGAPIRLDDLAELPAGRARREATERIMDAIANLSRQERSDSFAEGGRGA